VEIGTLCDVLTHLDRHFRKPDLLRYKSGGSWKDISTQDFVATVRSLTLGLESLGIGKGDPVAILSENRPEWTAFDHALLNLGAISVPIFPTLLIDQVRFILDNSAARVLVASGSAQFEKIRPALPSLKALQRVILMDPPPALPEGVLPWGAVAGAGEKIDRAEPERFDRLRSAVGQEDLASILYTSGTTGEPKGVMLTHGNIVSNVNATLRLIPFSATDSTLSILPLSHILERMVEFAYLSAGASLSFAESFHTVSQDILEVRPTVVACVPLFFDKVHDRVIAAAGASPLPRRLLFALALGIGRRQARASLAGRAAPVWVRLLHPAADRMVFSKIRERMGGRIRFFISGGAPLSARTAEFFYAAGVRVLEGYGLTETSPVIAVNTLERTRIGTVGPVIPGVEVRIAEDGEILARGPNVMKGYFRNEEATRAAMEGGWFHTGDIGEIDADGFLKITDRKKELLKTSGGKLVAPQPLESLLRSDRFISQAVAIGDRRKFIAALIVPNFQWLESYARHKQIPFKEVSELMENPRVLDLYRRRIEAKMRGLPSYEVVKKFRFLPRELTPEAGELTPSLKIKRRVIEQKFAELIESIYRE
jgi:long-chain acyl-CoA synthetase